MNWNEKHLNTLLKQLDTKNQRIAELEKELDIYKAALQIGVIDRTLGGNDPLQSYIDEARNKLVQPEEAK
jgi:hypothetical protein